MFKKSAITFLSISSLVPAIFFAALYIYDPMQLFHQSYFQKELHLHSNMRQQAAGIINNYDFDSIILGTSMLENTSASEASKKLGGKFVNMSMSGSDFYERSHPLRYSLKRKSIKTVIFSLDSSYISQRKGHRRYDIGTFNYLYDSNRVNDFNAYLNNKFLKCTIKLSSASKCIGRKSSLDRPNSWHESKAHSVRFGGLDNWFKAKNNNQIKSAFASIVSVSEKIKKGEVVELPKDLEEQKNKSEKYVDEFVLDYAKQYRETKFILVFPPYSRMRYAQWAQYNLASWEIHKHIVRYLANKSDELGNLEVYGYEDQDFLDDIANYKDLGHYHYSINSRMLDDFKDKKYLLTNSNIDVYISEAESRAKNYNVFEIAVRIKEFLDKDK